MLVELWSKFDSMNLTKFQWGVSRILGTSEKCTSRNVNCRSAQWIFNGLIRTVLICVMLCSLPSLLLYRSTRWCSWLRHCATSRKVAGSIPDGVTGIFHWHNPSVRTMALGLIQPLTEISNRNNSWGQRPSCADCLEIWEPQTPGTPRACQGL
jgi:hypothetical protein